MASSKNSCFNCNEFTSAPLMNGWKFFTGEHAQLCYYCHCIYKSGEFCETFHSDEDGWKECEACNKLIHCGCLASLTKYSLHKFSGITCNDCSDANLGIGPSAVLIPLFEKLASASDANLGISRLVIPKDYAKAHFPVVSDYQKIPVDIIDTDGNEWDDIYFRCWPCGYSKTYVLTGLRDFIISKNLQKGDIGINLMMWKIADVST
ncbi:B3 domain-containing protein [Tanacetum coccineum]